MGVLPKTDKLADVFLDLLSSQVGGLYCPERQEAVRRAASGRSRSSSTPTSTPRAAGPELRPPESSLRAITSPTRMARQAVVEGDAYVTMTYWLQQASAGREPLVCRQRPGEQTSPKIPPLLVQSSSSPPSRAPARAPAPDGRRLGPFAKPPQPRPSRSSTPRSTQPRGADRRPAAGRPRRRMGTGWSVARTRSVSTSSASVDHRRSRTRRPRRGRPGWGGDRVALLTTANGRLVLKTAWDTANDAAEFETAIAPRVAQAGGPGMVPGRATRSAVSSDGRPDAGEGGQHPRPRRSADRATSRRGR